MLRILLLILTLMPFCQTEAGVWRKVRGDLGSHETCVGPTIRVLVGHNLEKVNLGVDGPYSLFDPNRNCYLSSRFVGKCRAMESLSDGLRWGESFPGIYQLKISPDQSSSMIQLDGVSYPGAMYVYDIHGMISLVNQAPLDDYVRSLLGSEELDALQPEVLAALVIVARTNAYYQSANPKTSFWAVDGEKEGYHGIVNDHPKVDQAVAITRHMVMSRTGVYEGVSTPFPAQFGPYTPILTKNLIVSQITLEEAEGMARNGSHAAQILAKAFPGTYIMLIPF